MTKTIPAPPISPEQWAYLNDILQKLRPYSASGIEARSDETPQAAQPEGAPDA